MTECPNRDRICACGHPYGLHRYPLLARLWNTQALPLKCRRCLCPTYRI